jgi:tRNA threonylcarbamoyladenosine biosynthesis protein TsaB
MNVLVLDTSTECAVIGLASRSGKRYTATAGAPRRHGRDLIPRLSALLADAGLAPRDLDLIGVGLGPGSYTGLRVGVTAAKTLALATGAALVGLDSLEAIARGAPEHATQITVVADAQRELVYSADFIREAPGAPLVVERASEVEPYFAWLARLKAGVVVLGPGREAPSIRAGVPPEFLANVGMTEPDGLRLIEQALDVWESGRRENHWLLEPRYLRRSAAEEQWDARSKPASS